MVARLRLTVGVVLSVSLFVFFIVPVRSQETSDTSTSSQATTSTEVIGTTKTAEITEPIQASDTATSTEVIENITTVGATSTTETVEAQPVINGETEFAATSTPIEIEGLSPSSQASSSPITNATSTELIQSPLPEKEFILQPSVDLKIDGDTVSAQIALHNLSCRACDKSLKETNVIAYYTAWYPNDGEIKEIGPRGGETSLSVSGLANWGEYKTDWTSKAAPGRYYFVVLTDPNNLNNLYERISLSYNE